MSKGQDSKKNTKKKPLLTAKEKNAAKSSKKSETNVLGNKVSFYHKLRLTLLHFAIRHSSER